MINKSIKLKKIFIFLGLTFFVGLGFLFANDVLAQTQTNNVFGLGRVSQSTGLGGQDIRVTIARIIRVALGLLGIIALVIMIYGGYTYMTAGGNEEKVSQAKKIMINGSIGLVIILSAFAITQFVLTQLGAATGTGVVANCSDPAYAAANPTQCGAGGGPGGGFNPCTGNSSQQFVVRTITPSAPNNGTVDINNFSVRAIFSQSVSAATAADSVLTILRDGANVNSEFNFAYLDTARTVLEAAPINATLSAGNYSISVQPNLQSAGGNSLQTTTQCGNFPTATTFQVNTNVVMDSVVPTIPNNTVTYNGVQYGGAPALPRGQTYLIGADLSDDNGIGYAHVRLTPQGGGTVIENYDAPLISNGSAATASNPYTYNYQLVLAANAATNVTYDGLLEVYDIDGNLSSQTFQFTVVDQSCQFGTGFGTNPGCRQNAGCTQNADCASGRCVIPPGQTTGQCAAVPLITDVNLWDGAGGNWVTILGQFFGDANGTVEFGIDTDTDGSPDQWVPASLAQCGTEDVWTDSWIIVEVPPNDAALPNNSDSVIRVTRAGGGNLSDTTADGRGSRSGPRQGFFRKDNSLVRPSLCSVRVSPGQTTPVGATAAIAGTNVTAIGKSFGPASGAQLNFGGVQSQVSSWSATQIDATIPANIQPGRVGVIVTSASGEDSNGIPFQILTTLQNQTPVIEAINPSSSTPGSFVTITGSRFGQSPGTIYLAQGTTTCPGAGCTVANLPTVCGSLAWQDTQIIMELPANLAIGGYNVIVESGDTNIQSVPNATSVINVNNGAPLPSICAVNPNSGPAPLLPVGGVNPLTITGVNFSNSPTVRFWGRNSLTANPLTNTELNTWLSTSGNQITVANSLTAGDTVTTPIPVQNGYSMQTGPIVVTAGSGNNLQVSNSVEYTVTDCRDIPSNQIPAGQRCCTEGPSAGVFRPASFSCPGEVRDGGYVWRFTTGRIASVPLVLEACNQERWIGNRAVAFPSPTPWDGWQQGDDVCLNRDIAVMFNMDMDPNSFAGNVSLFTCAEASNGRIDCSGGNKIDISNQVNLNYTSRVLTIRPAPLNNTNNLQPDTWYRVELGSSIQSQEVITEFGSSRIVNQPLQATRNCGSGTAYCFEFKTGGPNNMCALTGAGIEPPAHVTDRLGTVLDPAYPVSDNQPLYYKLWGRGDQTCAVLNVDGLGWNWRVAAATNPLASAVTVSIAPGNGYRDSRATARAFRSTAPQSVQIEASLPGGVTAGTGNSTVSDFAALAGVPLDVPVGGNPIVIPDPSNIYTFDYTNSATMTIRMVLNNDDPVSVANGWQFGAGAASAQKVKMVAAKGDYSVRLQTFGNRGQNQRRRDFRFFKNDTPNFSMTVITSRIQNWSQALPTNIGNGNWVIPSSLDVNTGQSIQRGYNNTTPSSNYHIAQDANNPLVWYIPDTEFFDEFEIQITQNGTNWRMWWRNVTQNSPLYMVGEGNAGATTVRNIGGDILIGMLSANPVGVPDNYYLDGRLTAFTLEKESRSQLQNSNIGTVVSDLTVDLGTPRAIEFWPNCSEACANATLGAKFNRDMDDRRYQNGLNVYTCTDRANCTSNTVNRNNRVPFTVDQQLSNRKELHARPTAGAVLQPDTWYYAELTGAILSVASVNAAGGITSFGPSLTPTNWIFKTKATGEICVADNARISPDPFTALVIGQKTKYTVIPRTNPDSCNVEGQDLNPWSFGWQWNVADTNIATVSNFSTAALPKNNCTNGCLPGGSDIDSATHQSNPSSICGNGVVEAGEDCDVAANVPGTNTAEIPGISCNLSCLRPGNGTVGTGANQCGNGIVEPLFGEECDPAAPNAQNCSATCTNQGTPSFDTFAGVPGTFCGGDGLLEAGEDCEISGAGAESSEYCSNSCVHLGSQLSQAWCDDPVNASLNIGNLTAGASLECTDASSVCGNGLIEFGEECEVVSSGGSNVVVVYDPTQPGRGIVTNAPISSCSNRCLLQNICNTDVPDVGAGRLRCNDITDEDCNVDCTLSGSSVSRYSTASVCGDGVVGLGETSWCEYTAVEIANLQSLGQNPIQVVEAIGQGNTNPQTGNQETTVDATAIATLDATSQSVITLPLADQITGTGNYALQCGFTEFAEPRTVNVSGVNTFRFNDCPNATDGVGTNSCCYNRPTRSSSYPADGQGFANAATPALAAPVCRNTAISITFDTVLDEDTLNRNLFLAKGYTQSQNVGNSSNADNAYINNLSDVGGVTTDTGIVSSAYYFDGLVDRLQSLPDTATPNSVVPAYDFATADFTVHGWIKTSSTAQIETIASQGYSTNRWVLDLQNGVPNGQICQNGQTPACATVTANSNLADDRWHHVALSLDRDGEMRLYIDGLLEDSTNIAAYNNNPINGVANSATYSLNIGANVNVSSAGAVNYTSLYNGLLDEVTIEKRVIRSGEVQALADKTTAGQNQGNCPAGEFDVTNLVNRTLALNDIATDLAPKSLWHKLWQGIKTFFARLWFGVVHASGTNDPNVVVWCAGDVTFETNATPAYDTVGNVVGTDGILSINSVLEENTSYAVVLRGGVSGIKDLRGVGIGSPDSNVTRLDDSILFRTGTDICKLNSVGILPNKYIFSAPNTSTVFVANAVSTNDQSIVSIPGQYEWSWDWQPQGDQIFSIPSTVPPATCGNGVLDVGEDCDGPLLRATQCSAIPGRNYTGGNLSCNVTTCQYDVSACTPSLSPTDTSIIKIASNNLEGSRTASANATVTFDSDTQTNQAGEVFSGKTDLTALFCERPWPPVAYFPFEEGVPFGANVNNDGVDAAGVFDGTALPAANVAAGTGGVNGQYFNFGTSYCADAGASGDTSDDLPYLKPFVFGNLVTAGTCSRTNTSCFADTDCSGQLNTCQGALASTSQIQRTGLLKQMLFFNDTNEDVVGIQIFQNTGRDSVRQWYEKQPELGFVPSDFRDVRIAGYEAITDGDNYYVNALNQSSGGGIFNNVYLFSINQNASESTREVFDQLLNGLEFNINISDVGYCLANTVSAATTRVGETGALPISSVQCADNFDCKDVDGTPLPNTNGICSSSKTKFIRDWERLHSIREAQQKLSSLRDASGNINVPTLSSGSYIPGYSTSKWPSWGLLGSQVGGLKTDPVNKWSSCGVCAQGISTSCVSNLDCPGVGNTCTALGVCSQTVPQGCGSDADCPGAGNTCSLIDNQTCWDEQSSSFVCPRDSNIFEYSAVSNQNYTVHAQLEYFTSQSNIVQEFIDPNSFSTNRVCSAPFQVQSPFSAVCGDGVLNPATEQCDPPGRTQLGTTGITGVATAGVCAYQGTNQSQICNTDVDCSISLFENPVPGSSGSIVSGRPLFNPDVSVEMGSGQTVCQYLNAVMYPDSSQSNTPPAVLPAVSCNTSADCVNILVNQIATGRANYSTFHPGLNSGTNVAKVPRNPASKLDFTCAPLFQAKAFKDISKAQCVGGTIQNPVIGACPAQQVAQAVCDSQCQLQYGSCQAGGVCGDGRVDPATEQCDDGARNGTYGNCASDCRGPHPQYCGNGGSPDIVGGRAVEYCEIANFQGINAKGFCSVERDGFGVQTSGTNQALSAVHFVDEQNGWAGGNNSTLLRTNDGGVTWQTQNLPTIANTHNVNSIKFVDVNTGWLLDSNNNLVWRTIDGGSTWVQSNTTFPRLGSGTFTLPNIYFDMNFVDRNNGWVSASGNRIFRTIDGGRNWTQGNALPNNFNSIHFVSATEGWAASGGSTTDNNNQTYNAAGFIYRTTDSGNTWNLSYQYYSPGQPGNSHLMRGVYFVDSQDGWAVGDSGIILSTKDGGTSWQIQQSPVNTNLQKVYFVDNFDGYIIDVNNNILKTTDGGLSWVRANTNVGSTITLNDLHASGVGAWTVGSQGTILKTGLRLCAVDSDCGANNTCLAGDTPTYHIDQQNSCAFDCQGPGGYCGDGVVQPQFEECDDGNNINNDACSNLCLVRAAAQSSAIISQSVGCGNGVTDPGEACDLGSQNGVACIPSYNESCTYCSNSCDAVLTVDAAGYCGNRELEIITTDSAGQPVYEACEVDGGFILIDPDVTKPDAQRYVRTQCTGSNYNQPTNFFTVNVGQRACQNSCTTYIDNCIPCGSKNISQGGVAPSLAILNVIEDGAAINATAWATATNAYLRVREAGFYVARGEMNLQLYSGQSTQSYTTQKRFLNTGNIVDGGLESNALCSGTYGVEFNNSVTQTVQGSVYNYPVNSDSQTVGHEILVSPAVAPGTIRVVVRWTEAENNEGVTFGGALYNESFSNDPNPNRRQPITYGFATSIIPNGICSRIAQDTAGYWVPSGCSPSLTNGGNGAVWVHSRNNLQKTFSQTFTIDTAELVDARPYAFFVESIGQISSVPIINFENSNLQVEIYESRVGQNPGLSIYKPTRNFNITTAAGTSSNSLARYWQVFNLSATNSGYTITPVEQIKSGFNEVLSQLIGSTSQGSTSPNTVVACTAADWNCQPFPTSCPVSGTRSRVCTLINTSCANASAVQPPLSQSCTPDCRAGNLVGCVNQSDCESVAGGVWNTVSGQSSCVVPNSVASGGACSVDAACQTGLSCVNNLCS